MHLPRTRRRAIAAGIVAVVLCSRHARAVDEPTDAIQYSNDALTVHLTGVPISHVLQELARQSGAEIRGDVRQQGDVTADFQSVPLPEALARLLHDQGFALVYRKGGRLKAVRLLGGDQPVAWASEAPAPAVTPPTPRPPFPGALPELMARHPPVPVSGPLADALGSQSATLEQLLDLSLHHADPTVRAEAMRTGVGAMEEDPELRDALISELGNVDGASLGGLLRASASEQAEDVALQVLRTARLPEIRVKASAVLQRLRAGG